MLRDACFPVARVYAVEVSGWNAAGEFFVEQCELEWDEDASKQVTLKRTLGENTLLLVRLVQEEDSDRSHPVVYEAEWVGKTKAGRQQFRLNAVVPA